MENSAEQKFYEDGNVIVTQSRFVASSKTYAMRNISSMSIGEIKKSKVFQILVIIVGVIMLTGEGTRVYGVVAIAMGALLLYFIRNEYSVRINSNSGENDGFVSKDRERIEKIVNAVNEAMVLRG